VDLIKLHKDSRALLEDLADRLPADLIADYRSFSDAGEWDELLDVLSATLIKRGIPVTPTERDRLAGLLAMFNAPREGYAYISAPEQTIASLRVLQP
jgi:hypothetical protein